MSYLRCLMAWEGSLIPVVSFEGLCGDDFLKQIESLRKLEVAGRPALEVVASTEKYGVVLANLKREGVEHSVHGSDTEGSVYFRDPDNILLEVTTGYD